jgi:hypothetical protein
MSRWFRLYDDVLDDPKVQRLPPVLFKAWVNLLCLTSRNDGKLPSADDIAFALRTDIDTANGWLDDLVSRGLLDERGDDLSPHNWHERQFKSDRDPTASERQRRKRDRDRDGKSSHANVTRDVTPPRADTDTDTDAASSEAASAARGDLDKIEADCREAAGATDNPSPALIDVSPIIRCRNAGADMQAHVLPVIREITARGHHWRSWAYAERAIMDRMATMASQAPTGHATGPPNRVPKAYEQHDRLMKFIHEAENGQREADWQAPRLLASG